MSARTVEPVIQRSGDESARHRAALSVEEVLIEMGVYAAHRRPHMPIDPQAGGAKGAKAEQSA